MFFVGCGPFLDRTISGLSTISKDNQMLGFFKNVWFTGNQAGLITLNGAV
jgi:hypothetical protein